MTVEGAERGGRPRHWRFLCTACRTEPRNAHMEPHTQSAPYDTSYLCHVRAIISRQNLNQQEPELLILLLLWSVSLFPPQLASRICFGGSSSNCNYVKSECVRQWGCRLQVRPEAKLPLVEKREKRSLSFSFCPSHNRLYFNVSPHYPHVPVSC